MPGRKFSDFPIVADFDDLGDYVPFLNNGVNARAPKSLFTDTFAPVGTTAAVTELTAGSFIAETIAGNGSFPIWYAPFPCTIESCAIVNMTGAIATSDVNYWTVNLNRMRAAAQVGIAVKTTQTTGGQAVTNRVPWTFDAITFGGYKTLAAGDMVVLAIVATGTPTAWGRVHATIRYVPT